MATGVGSLWRWWTIRQAPARSQLTFPPLPRVSEASEVAARLRRGDCNAVVLLPPADETALSEQLTNIAAAAAAAATAPFDIRARGVPGDAPQIGQALRDLLQASSLRQFDAASTFHLVRRCAQLVLAFHQSLEHLAPPSLRYDLRLATVQQTPCPRFHSDTVPLRLLCTLVGPGTEVVREAAVNRAMFEAARRAQRQASESDDADAAPEVDGVNLAALDADEHARQLVLLPQVSYGVTQVQPRGERKEASASYIHDPAPHAPIERVRAGEALFLKGNQWPGNDQRGAVHRSPRLVPGRYRLIFQVDLSRPTED
ncbi:hypothetical protein CDCA_CDCA12G3338 [Cyanidium caldarium]|uniref:DUF1826 domain-containing protein n=1 Tax=Cyanidium caldarium TaxID=2771 RepID=A0AAV9IYB7_CYACA|nr:hypothetical protein CDCA_CDCA12G3338 [Cyanidium caldarium]